MQQSLYRDISNSTSFFFVYSYSHIAFLEYMVAGFYPGFLSQLDIAKQ